MEWMDISPHERVKIICRHKQLTMEELATRVDASRFTVTHVLAGRQQGSMWLWRSIAETLGVRFGWLVEGEGEVWATKKGVRAASLPPLPPAPSIVTDEEPYRNPSAPIVPAATAPSRKRNHS